MNCPVCSNEMILAQATDFGTPYHYCRTCKKELAELQPKVVEPSDPYDIVMRDIRGMLPEHRPHYIDTTTGTCVMCGTSRCPIFSAFQSPGTSDVAVLPSDSSPGAFVTRRLMLRKGRWDLAEPSESTSSPTSEPIESTEE